MNFLNYTDDEVNESMQGVVGFKSVIPQSKDLRKFTLKWLKEYDHVMELKDINADVVSAYDGVSALAMAVEKTRSVLKLYTKDLATTGSAQWGTTLLNQMLRVSFDGLGGNFKFMNAKVMTQVLEIINVIHKKQVKVGFWTKDVGFTKKIGKLNYFPHDGLESIVWPGGVLNHPKHRMLQVSSRRLRSAFHYNIELGPLFEVEYDSQTNSTHVSGFCSAVFIAAFAGLDPNATFEFIPVIRAGARGGTYDDLIDQVQAGIFDAAIGDITITANRSLYVDFTLPYTDIGLATLSRKEATASLWIFMKPLSSDLWLVSACSFILLGFVIWILEHRTNNEFQGSPLQQIGVTLWFAFSTLVYAHRQKLESNLSRFVVTVWLFVVLVLVSSYTATLSSLLTIEQIQLASNRGFIISNWKHDHNSRMKPFYNLEDFAIALSRGSKKGGAYAIVDEIPYIKEFLARYPSGYSAAVTSDISNGFGFVFPKGSPLTTEMSTQIARLREDGTLKALEDKWFGQQSDQQFKDYAHALKILNFKGLRGLFLISAVSMAVSLFLFMLYHIHGKVHSTYANAGRRKASIHLEISVA